MAQSQSLKHDLLRPQHLVLNDPVRLPNPGGLGQEALSVRLHPDERIDRPSGVSPTH